MRNIAEGVLNNNKRPLSPLDGGVSCGAIVTFKMNA